MASWRVYTSFLANLILISGIEAQSSFSGATIWLGSPNVNLTCTGSSTDQVTFSVYNQKPTKLYVSGVGYFANVDQSKYIVSSIGGGSYNLTITNPQVGDALTYICDRTSSDEMFANIVVIGTPVVSVAAAANPTINTNPGFWGFSQTQPGLSVGNMVNLSCSVQYGAPSTDPNYISPLMASQTPTLQFLKNGIDITASAFINETESANAQQASTLYGYVIYTLQQSDIGASFNCVVYTKTPYYSNFTGTPINVNSPVRNVSFSVQNQGQAYVGQNVTCSAAGYPPPTVTLIPIPPTDTSCATVVNGQGVAYMTLLTATTQYWNCTATSTSTSGQNFPGYNSTGTSIAIEFTVSNYNGTYSQNAGVALGVGLGIGLGLPILIIIIIVIVLLCRKRSGYKPANQKKPEKKTNSGKQNSSSDANRPKRPEPQPPNNARTSPVNLNPNPYAVPVPSQQTSLSVPRVQVGRDSPGYGDIGARQMSGTGTPVNESFDSSANRSFDQDRRQVPKKNNTGRVQNGRPNTDV